MQFRLWPVAAAAIATVVTTAIASADSTSIDSHGARVPRVIPQTQRHLSTAATRRPVTAAVATRVPVSRVGAQDDTRLLSRINQVQDESCAAVMRDRPDFDTSILAGIIQQRRDTCQRGRFAGRRFNGQSNGARFADRDDQRIRASRFADRDDQRIRASRFADRDDQRIRASRFADRDDRRVPSTRFVGASRLQAGRGLAADRASRSNGRPRPQ